MIETTNVAVGAQRERARALAGKIAGMSETERQALADRLPAVVNPDGHALTVHNTVFLHMQSGRTDLTMVAGFRQWIRAGRAVRKGEHSCGYIFVPLKRKKDDDRREGEQSSHDRIRFRLVPVFDLSQTDELAEVPA